MTVMESDVASASSREADQAASAAAAKQGRKSLEDRLADIRAEERKIIEQMRKRDKEARAQFEKDLWALLKSEKLDEAPIEAWRKAAPAIAVALKAATA